MFKRPSKDDPYPALNKNVEIINDRPFFKRWTILGVDVEVVDFVKQYAERHNVTVGRALKEIVLGKNA
jgi:hypothetical protein